MLVRTVKLARWLPAAAVVIVALVAWPPAESAFRGPKDLALLGLATAALLVAGLHRRVRGATLAPRVPVLLGIAWLLALGLSSVFADAARPAPLARDAGAALLFVGLAITGVTLRPLVQAGAFAGAAVASVCAFQLFGLDPFGWIGFERASQGARLSVYGTLGNPDFVASFLTVTLILTAAPLLQQRARVIYAGAAALQLLALAGAQSFATVLALGAAASTIAAVKRSTRPALLALAAMGVLALPLVGRDLGRAAEGRLYLWRVAAPHLLARPVTGFGPGAFEVLWPAWEAEHFADGAPESDLRFAGLQEHAHADFLERALDLGAGGALVLGALLLLSARAALRRARQSNDAEWTAVAAALVALGARSLVDFPLARPAELCVFAVLCAAALGRTTEEST